MKEKFTPSGRCIYTFVLTTVSKYVKHKLIIIQEKNNSRITVGELNVTVRK